MHGKLPVLRYLRRVRGLFYSGRPAAMQKLQQIKCRREVGTPMDMTTIVVAASIPSAFTGFCFWLIEQNLKKRADNEKEEREERQKQLDEREQIREKNELCIINSVNAAIALGEATARAVQRIPDAHCNGDMHAALDYAQKVKHEQKNFLNEQALKHIIEEGEQTS